MTDITLFEFHLDEASFSNTAPFFGGQDEGAAAADTAEEDGGGNGKLLVLLALGLVVAIAWLVSRSEVGEGIEIDEAIELST